MRALACSLVLGATLFASACGAFRSHGSANESSSDTTSTPQGPDSPEACAAAHADQPHCRWSVEMVDQYGPNGARARGPVCVCNGCETDADCEERAACRLIAAREPGPGARVCVTPRDPCFHDPSRCGSGRVCAHDGNAGVGCFAVAPETP